jgi:hypothetical protein
MCSLATQAAENHCNWDELQSKEHLLHPWVDAWSWWRVPTAASWAYKCTSKLQFTIPNHFSTCLSEEVVFLFEIFSKIILVFNLEECMTLCIWDLLVEYPSQNFYCTIFGYVPQDVKKHLPRKEDEDQHKLEICLWHISLVPPQPQIIIDN